MMAGGKLEGVRGPDCTRNVLDRGIYTQVFWRCTTHSLVGRGAHRD